MHKVPADVVSNDHRIGSLIIQINVVAKWLLNASKLILIGMNNSIIILATYLSTGTLSA